MTNLTRHDVHVNEILPLVPVGAVVDASTVVDCGAKLNKEIVSVLTGDLGTAPDDSTATIVIKQGDLTTGPWFQLDQFNAAVALRKESRELKRTKRYLQTTVDTTVNGTGVDPIIAVLLVR